MTRIREYRPEDLDQLRTLAHASYGLLLPPDTGEAEGEAAREVYFQEVIQIPSSGRGVILVAEAGQELVGFVCLLGLIQPTGNEQNRSSEPYAFLSDLFVRPANRKQGIGSRLTEAAEKHARRIGACRIALKVLTENQAALQFHQRHHYAERFVIMDKQL